MGDLCIPDWMENQPDPDNSISWEGSEDIADASYLSDLPSSPTSGDTEGLELSSMRGMVSYRPRGQELEGGTALRRRGSVIDWSSIDRVWVQSENHTITSSKGS